MSLLIQSAQLNTEFTRVRQLLSSGLPQLQDLLNHDGQVQPDAHVLSAKVLMFQVPLIAQYLAPTPSTYSSLSPSPYSSPHL